MKNTEKKLEIIDRTISIGYNPNTGLKELQRTINDAIEKSKHPIIKHNITGGYVALYREETDKEYQRRTEDLRKRQQLGGLAEIKVEGQRIVLCHYAMDVWNRSHHGTWHLFGHSHHTLPVKPNSKRMDVGINGIDYNYTPLEFSQIKVIMDQIEFIPIDHHDRKSR
jgi:calcineurin-like phosphoesterase family protein